MQLKRDTDYALRILSCIGSRSAEGTMPPEGISLRTISSQTGVPKLSVNRVCRNLEHKKILSVETSAGGDLMYRPAEGFYERTLLDAIMATEGSFKLFAVFDKKTALYRKYRGKLEKTQEEVEKSLQKITMKDLSEGGKR
ncbi:MAG: Rrf2 family transcriptional regulator [Clostridia bacterium]|nr:Rrf2 family transcriptional regulator [Clostridia bacterium]